MLEKGNYIDWIKGMIPIQCYIIIHIMLARIVSRRLSLLFKNRAAFGSSHDHHDHHDYHVEVNRDQPWVKYNSVILT